MSIPENTPEPTAAAPTESACPPPLAWQEVLQEFHQQATPWYLDRPRYRISGRMWGTGSPIYFFNGMGGTFDLYALTVWLLRDQFRCVLFDYPGTPPGSTADLRNLSLPQLAEDVFAIADRCGDGTFDVFATSFGGLVATECLLQQTQRIRRVILQGTFAARNLSLAERLLIRVCRFPPGRLGHVPFSSRVQSINHRRSFPPFDATRWEFFVQNSAGIPVKSLAHRAGIIRDTDFRDRLSSIKQPVLLMHCEEDGLVPERYMTEIQQRLPQARFETVMHAGHIPYLTHPHRMAKLIREFLL